MGQQTPSVEFLDRPTVGDYYGKKNFHMGFRIARQRYFRGSDWAAVGLQRRRVFRLFGRRFCVYLLSSVAN